MMTYSPLPSKSLIITNCGLRVSFYKLNVLSIQCILTNMELKISFLDQMSRLDIFEDSRSRKDKKLASFFMFITFNTIER